MSATSAGGKLPETTAAQGGHVWPHTGGAESQTLPQDASTATHRSFPLNILLFGCSLVSPQNLPLPFVPLGFQLEIEAVSKPVAALRGGECISTAHTMQF